MMRKNGLLGLLVLFVLLLAASSLGVASAQQTRTTPQPTAMPAAQPTVQPSAQPAAPAAMPEYPYLGVRLADTANGITIGQVMDGSPAATAGLKAGDIIQKLNDTAVANVSAFADALNQLKIGDKVTLAIMRDGKAMNIDATLASSATAGNLVTNEAFNAIAFNAADKSWQVFSLVDRSDLATAGLQMGDTIAKFDGKTYNPADLHTYLSGLTDKDQVKLTVTRAGKSVDVTVPAPAFKSLDLFNYAQQGMLLDLVVQNKGVQPALNLGDLNHAVPFDAFGYNLTDKSWHIFGLADGSSLAASGLKPEDQITQFDGTAYDPANLQTYREKLADNATVKLTVERAGKSLDVSVPAATLNSLHLFDYQSSGMLFGMPSSAYYGPSVGFNTIQLTADVARQHNVKQTDGALVIQILPNTPAAAAGLQMNDVVTAVNGQKVDAQHTLDSLLAAHKPGDKVKFSIARADKNMDLTVTLAAPDISGEIPFLIRPM